MEYRAFQYGEDERYIKAILGWVAVAGSNVVWTEEWFRQRFEENPLGKAVLACAYDGDTMVSCVAVERFPIQCEGSTLVGGCMRVLYTEEGYGLQDMWIGLLKVLEKECRQQGIDIVFYCKEKDFISLNEEYGWKYIERSNRYRFISVTSLWRSIFKLMDMGKPFVARKRKKQGESVQNEMGVNTSVTDYYKWLIHTSDKVFVVVDNEEVCAVLAMGQRGKRVREAHICYFQPKKRVVVAQRSIVEFVRGYFTKGTVDVVSCVDGKNYLSKSNSIRISQKVNYCYKWLGEVVIDVSLIMKEDIMYMMSVE